MRIIFAFIIVSLFSWGLAWPQESQDAADLIAKMQTQLDLQPDQITNITPIIDRYTVLFEQLKKSTSDNTINPSSIDSQRQQLEAQETQELSQYLKPYQLSEWRDMQSQMDQQGEGSDNDADQYSNLPNQNPPSN